MLSVESWWFWMAAAFVLGIFEIMLPAFIFLGFAVAAAIMSLGIFIDIIAFEPFGLLAIYALLSLGAWVILQRVFRLRSEKRDKRFDHDINDYDDPKK